MAVLYLTEKAPKTNEDLLKGNLFKDFSDEDLKECWSDYQYLSANGFLMEDAFTYPILTHLNANSKMGTAEYATQLLTAISCRYMN